MPTECAPASCGDEHRAWQVQGLAFARLGTCVAREQGLHGARHGAQASGGGEVSVSAGGRWCPLRAGRSACLHTDVVLEGNEEGAVARCHWHEQTPDEAHGPTKALAAAGGIRVARTGRKAAPLTRGMRGTKP